MEITTIQRNIPSSPRKLRLVADMVRKMKPSIALQTLQFTNKAATLPLSKAIKTVLANAKQQNLEAVDLVFKKLEINEGYKGNINRMRAGSRGRGDPYKKRMSQIKIVLSNEDQKVRKQGKKNLNLKKKEVLDDSAVVTK